MSFCKDSLLLNWVLFRAVATEWNMMSESVSCPCLLKKDFVVLYKCHLSFLYDTAVYTFVLYLVYMPYMVTYFLCMCFLLFTILLYGHAVSGYEIPYLSTIFTINFFHSFMAMLLHRNRSGNLTSFRRIFLRCKPHWKPGQCCSMHQW